VDQRFPECKELAQRALAKCDEIPEPNDDRWDAYNLLACAEVELGKPDESKSIWHSVIEALEAKKTRSFAEGRGLFNALDCLGQLMFKEQNMEQAESLLLRALEARKEVLFANSGETAAPFVTLGAIHFARGDIAKAEEFYKKALPFLEFPPKGLSDVEKLQVEFVEKYCKLLTQSGRHREATQLRKRFRQPKASQ
jgi:tetratricopeptide (TPR) repeat protein